MRSSGERYTFREESARPSSSRTVGAADDLERLVEVAHHLADDGELLGVLAPEVGAVGLHEVKQLGDDGGDAIEVAGPRGALEAFGDAADADAGGVALGVHDVDAGEEGERDAGRLEEREVLRLGPGVAGEVLVGPELRGVHEDRGDDGRAVGTRGLDERDVPSMERAHGGDEADGPRQRSTGGAQILDGARDVHGPRLPSRRAVYGPGAVGTTPHVLGRARGRARSRAMTPGRPRGHRRPR